MTKAKLILTNGKSIEVDEARFDKLYLAVTQGRIKPDTVVTLDGHSLRWQDIDKFTKLNQESLHDIFTRKGLTCWCRACKPSKITS